MKYLTLPLVLFSGSLIAATDTTSEIMSAVEEEQQAFESGNCDKVESMMSKDITFYANGRKMTHEQVGKFCRSIPRPFGAGRSPIDDTTNAYKIDENLGYTIRDFKWHDKDERVVHEVVTKIWAKGDHGWKIIHFQSTVLPVMRPPKKS